MKPYHLLVPLILTLLLGSSSFADNPSEAAHNLESAVLKELAGTKSRAPSGNPDSGDYVGRPWRLVIAELDIAVKSNDQGQIIQLLEEITGSFRSTQVLNAAKELLSVISVENEAKENALDAEADAAIASASEKIKSAKTPADLDSTVKDMFALYDRLNTSGSERTGKRSDRVSRARDVVIRWQDYLSNRAAGKNDDAMANLRTINESSSELVPRSLILSLMNTPAGQPASPTDDEARAILKNVKSLDDVAGAIAAIDKLTPDGTNRSDPQNYVIALSSLLNSIQHTYVSYNAGIPCDLAITLEKVNGFPINGEATTDITPLRAQLMRLVFPRYLGVDEKPADNEPIEAYLNRVMAKASSSLDARMMGRVTVLLNGLQGKDEPPPPALQSLIVAQNQDVAGQFMLATASYQTALKTGGDIVPAKEIGARLAAIKSAHPEEYRQGTEHFMAEGAARVMPTPPHFPNPFQSGIDIRVPGKLPDKP